MPILELPMFEERRGFLPFEESADLMQVDSSAWKLRATSMYFRSFVAELCVEEV
jgi:hypothetical protein